ncbi:MAG: hypothetical protein AVDCRST_MAG42-731, partial [uncultured Chthoniobacterales bacterium]
ARSRQAFHDHRTGDCRDRCAALERLWQLDWPLTWRRPRRARQLRILLPDRHLHRHQRGAEPADVAVPAV